MPSLDEQAALAQHERYEAESRATADQIEQARLRAAAIATRLDKLLANEEVTWFLTTFVDPMVTREHDLALNLTKTAGERDISAHRHAMAVELRALLAKQRDDHAARAVANPAG